MKLNFALIVGLTGHTVLASPVIQRDDSTTLATLMSTIKNHTANINATLAKLPTVTTTATTSTATAGLASGSANITAQFNAIAQAMTSATFDSASTTNKRGGNNNLPVALSSRQDTKACDATCLSASYTGIGALTAELAYTVKGCVAKNAIDITTSSSVLIPVIQGLAKVTKELALVVGPVAGVVVQNLEVALGADIGGVLATFILPA